MSMTCASSLGFAAEERPKVVVVGAGIAGLTAAYRLHNEGVDVHLYEARNRVGGRIFTAKVNGRIAELGGQNIGDGGEAVHLTRLINELGLELDSSRVYLKDNYFNGTKLTPVNEIIKAKEFDVQSLREQIDRLSATSLNMREVLEKMFSVEDPLYKVLAVRLAAYEGGSIERLSPLYRETLFHMLLGGICSVHQGSQNEDTYVDLMTVHGGNSLLPEKIAETLSERIHLNMALKKVAKTQNGGFHLTFQNGEQVEADILVLAIPCSVYGQISFADDVIPPQKLDQIRDVRYGENAKIMVPFIAPPVKTTGVVGNEIVSFFDVGQQLLTVYYTGKTSFFSSETIANSYIQARPMIEAGFGDNCPSYEEPVYAEDLGNLSYNGAVGYSWVNDQYAKGTYSYIASGQESTLVPTFEERGETFKALFSPIQERLYFAGEHTSILSEVPGTMEAACESGERVARVILKNQKLSK
ncbi:MAG: FAD-dependent oxidoreductase [Chlamydiales bacterium]|nr:FAD-dependent oxidoreductase [Chlamydiales bacterium]